MGKAKLVPGSVVRVCWRKQLENPFLPNPAPFECSGTLEAVAAPWNEQAGSVTGKQLLAAVRPGSLQGKQGKVYAKHYEAGARPDTPTSAIGIDDSDSSYFDNYVWRDSTGANVAYLEVELDVGGGQ